MTPRRRGFKAPVQLVVCAVSALAPAIAASARAGTAQVAATATIADTQHVTIKVVGMFCESCEATVHAMLKRTPGVYSAKVDVKRGAASVVYDPKKTSPQVLADVINRLGYKATLPPAKAKSVG